MAASMYDNSIPVFIHGLNNLSAILKKAETWAAGKKIEQNTLVNLRLIADMFPLARQIQITSDAVKGFGGRISGAEIPSFPDTETNLEELQERIAKTIKFLQTIKREQVDGAEGKAINLKVGAKEWNLTGVDYLNKFVIPSFYFHITTAYAILRSSGLELGKMDFLGNK